MTVFASSNKVDDSRWLRARAALHGSRSTPEEVTLAYIDSTPAPKSTSKGVIVLIHGFPETSYQFRHVITPLSNDGYRVIAPDYRGAGGSSHPRSGYDKVTMASDIRTLLRDHLNIKEKVHIVGHDIGGMVAHAYAARFADDTASVIWGECPLPGTGPYERLKNDPTVWHFTFHQQADLPEALVAGHEDTYLEHFYKRLANDSDFLSEEDFQHYVRVWRQAGAFRCGFDTYRAFHADADANTEWVKKNGKCQVPCLGLNGAAGAFAPTADEQTKDMYADPSVDTVPNSGHWIAEENPQGFVESVLRFVGRHNAS